MEEEITICVKQKYARKSAKITIKIFYPRWLAWFIDRFIHTKVSGNDDEVMIY